MKFHTHTRVRIAHSHTQTRERARKWACVRRFRYEKNAYLRAQRTYRHKPHVNFKTYIFWIRSGWAWYLVRSVAYSDTEIWISFQFYEYFIWNFGVNSTSAPVWCVWCDRFRSLFAYEHFMCMSNRPMNARDLCGIVSPLTKSTAGSWKSIECRLRRAV